MYSSLREVEVVRHSAVIKDHYSAEYEKYRGAIPYLDAQNDKLFRWIIINFELDKAKNLVTEFLATQDEWYEKHSYSMYCLQKNVNKILASLGKRQLDSRSSGMMLLPELSCDQCGVKYERVCSAKELCDSDRPRLCDNCI